MDGDWFILIPPRGSTVPFLAKASSRYLTAVEVTHAAVLDGILIDDEEYDGFEQAIGRTMGMRLGRTDQTGSIHDALKRSVLDCDTLGMGGGDGIRDDVFVATCWGRYWIAEFLVRPVDELSTSIMVRIFDDLEKEIASLESRRRNYMIWYYPSLVYAFFGLSVIVWLVRRPRRLEKR